MSQAEEIWGELQDDGCLRRHRVSLGTEDGEEPDETTGLLRGGSMPIGRRRGRRWAGRGRRKREQDATGGWWRMKWWRPKGEEGEEEEGYGGIDEEVGR